MILKIDYDTRNVIYQGEGRLLLKVNFYAEFAEGCHLATTEGTTKEEFDRNKAKACKSVFIGQRGGLSIS